MNKNQIRLSESQLHKVIKESIIQVLNEYDWNGRTPEQDRAAISAASKPASWKAHMLRAQDQQKQGRGYNRGLVNKAQNAFHDQYGTKYDYYEDNFAKNGQNSNMIRGSLTRVAPHGGRLSVNQNQGSAERYHEKTYGDFNTNPNHNERNYGGYWGTENDHTISTRGSQETPVTRNQRHFSTSPQFQQRVNDIDSDMTDFYSGEYRQRMERNKQKLGNKGNY